MNVFILYLNHQGIANISQVLDMFQKDSGPLKFKLIESQSNTDYFQYHRSLDKISIENLDQLSNLTREHYMLDANDFLVIVSQKPLIKPNISFYSNKDWISFYENKNILVKSAGWNKLTEGKPYLGIAHQIIENLFQIIGNINLLGQNLDRSIHKEVEICINDFCENLSETKGKIRSGYICESCISAALNYTDFKYIIQIKKILGRISNRLRENYTYNFTDDELKIEVKKNMDHKDYSVYIGGSLIDFGHKGKLSLTAYLFYLINHNIGISKNDFVRKADNPQNQARLMFMNLYKQLYGSFYDFEMDIYVRDIRSVHSRISTRFMKQIQLDEIAQLYSFKSEKISQDVTNYKLELKSHFVNIPSELMQFRLSNNSS